MRTKIILLLLASAVAASAALLLLRDRAISSPSARITRDGALLDEIAKADSFQALLRALYRQA